MYKLHLPQYFVEIVSKLNIYLNFIKTCCSSSVWWKSNRKSSSELYREAAQLLGLSCTLSDNCRCLDCQVNLVNMNFKYKAN